MSPDLPTGRVRRAFITAWRQLPFFVWLVALWMLLWGQFTWLAFLTGLIAAIVVTRVFRLPPVELSGRVNLWWGLVFVLEFLVALVRGSLTVAWQVLRFGRQPGAAIIAVPLVTDDDLIMTHTAVTASLIPGSLLVDGDRDRRILYLHVIGVYDDAGVEAQRASVRHWEARIVRAVGSRAQLQAVRADAAARSASTGSATKGSGSATKGSGSATKGSGSATKGSGSATGGSGSATGGSGGSSTTTPGGVR